MTNQRKVWKLSLQYVAGVLISVCVLAIGCAHLTPESKAFVPPEPLEDTKYAPVFEKYHRYESVVERFQKQIDLHALLLIPAMRGAWHERFVRMRGSTPAPFNGEDLPWGFVVSVESPDRNYEFLDNGKIWTIQVGINGSFVPAKVEPLSERPLLAPFIPFTNQWTRDFLITAPSATPSEQVTLVLRSALTHLEIHW